MEINFDKIMHDIHTPNITEEEIKMLANEPSKIEDYQLSYLDLSLIEKERNIQRKKKLEFTFKDKFKKIRANDKIQIGVIK
jgi:hypothetical protein